LRDTSDLYALLVAYSDLGGCRAMVSATTPQVGRAPGLARACSNLQRSASAVARAARHSDAAALVRATREVSLAQPALVRAMLAIRRG
jgi:hypothetical protein